MSKETERYCPIKHYTSIESLEKILNSKSLLLGDPKEWPDKNDVASVEAFCCKKGGCAIRIVCFTKKETIQHWNDSTKKRKKRRECSIDFDENGLLGKLNKSFLKGDVEYKSLSSGDKEERISAAYLKKLDVDKLPFLKRLAYNCENEYRVIWFGQESKTKQNVAIKFSIKKAIISVTLAPKLKDRDNIKKILEKKYGIKVRLARIEESKGWISLFKQIAKNKDQSQPIGNRF